MTSFNQPRPAGRRTLLMICVVVLGIVGLFSGWKVWQNRATADERAASEFCFAWIVENPSSLNSPVSLASFEEATVTSTDQGYTVAFSAKVQDSAGGLVDRNFTCSIAKDATGRLTVLSVDARP